MVAVTKSIDEMSSKNVASLLEPLDEDLFQQEENKHERQISEYKNLGSRYLLWGRQDLDRKQFCSLYTARLEKMRPVLEKQARQSFGELTFASCFGEATSKASAGIALNAH